MDQTNGSVIESQQHVVQVTNVPYKDICIAFFRSSILCFGGGPAGIPLIETEVVRKYHWMTLEEFGDLVAIANALPGPINSDYSTRTSFHSSDGIACGTGV